MSELPLLAYVPLAAPLAALLTGFFVTHRGAPRLTHWPILASCAAVAAAALLLLWGALGGSSWSGTLWTMFSAGGATASFGLLFDPLTVSVLAMVSVVGLLIHVYAAGYMEHDPGFSRFFLYFHLFFFMMVGLLTSDNFLQLYLFWEGVGLASFLLIGFWSHKASARAAAWKAFLTNRVGDVGFLLAILLMWRWLGTLRFEEVFARLDLLTPERAFFVGFLLFWGACAKSAQFPLYVWLPDAMEGPTPVSALMHAATMVTAGVFLMARSYPILERAPGLLPFIALVGAVTAVWGAVGAFFRQDLKRILAYSTVSHLGLMMLGLGAGGVFPAVFHLVVHGFFKAALFLCAGNVIHGLHDALGGAPSASVEDAGGLRGAMPWTFGAFYGLPEEAMRLLVNYELRQLKDDVVERRRSGVNGSRLNPRTKRPPWILHTSALEPFADLDGWQRDLRFRNLELSEFLADSIRPTRGDCIQRDEERRRSHRHGRN